MLRHKGDLPTTETDTNFSAVHSEREGEDGDHYKSHIPTLLKSFFKNIKNFLISL